MVLVARVVANRLSSVEDFGVRDCGALIRRFGVARSRDVQGILVKCAWEDLRLDAIFLAYRLCFEWLEERVVLLDLQLVGSLGQRLKSF